jgi:hypothetical protein
MNNIENAENVNTASNQGLFILFSLCLIFLKKVFTCHLGILFQTVNQGIQYIQ